jgi:hypothetical protein
MVAQQIEPHQVLATNSKQSILRRQMGKEGNINLVAEVFIIIIMVVFTVVNGGATSWVSGHDCCSKHKHTPS